jgi:hypothetical protein
MMPKPKTPPRPPSPASQADASVQFAGQDVNSGYSSLISTSSTGLSKRPDSNKRSLIGGAS